MAKVNKSGYEEGSVVQNGPPAPEPVKKAKRKMSTGLQVCARIERTLDGLDAKTHNKVLAWLKELEPKEVQSC